MFGLKASTNPARPRLRGMAGPGLCAAILCCSPVAAFAQAPAAARAPLETSGTASADSLADFLLPYAPIIFDTVVSYSRYVVAVTYDARRYDPVTRDFVVSGLKLGREGFEASVDTIRIGASTSSYEGIAVDTRRLPLEPPLRDALKRLDSEVLRGSVVTSLSGDAASASYDLAVTADFEKIGLLTLAAKVDGFHVLVPLGGYEAELDPAAVPGGDAAAPSQMPVVLGTLQGATLSFDDRGLTPVLLAIAGEAQNMTADAMRGAVSAMAAPVLASAMEELPGGASPALQARAAGWSATLQDFLAKPGHIELRLTPPTPFPLSQLKEGMRVDEALIVSLNPDLSTVAGAPTAFVDPETDTVVGRDDMSLAERLVEGRGLPQDIGRGVALALADVAAGRPEAASIAVRGIGLDPDGAVSNDTAPASYVLLLLAKVRGERVPDAALASVRARLSEEAVAAAENQALNEWREGEAGTRQRAAEDKAAGARDWAGLRRLAFDYYEGRRAPRNVTRAFTLAEVAAAGGDRMAASLRDDLLRAERDGRLVFPVDAGRQAAVTLWSKIVTASAAAQPKPAQ